MKRILTPDQKIRVFVSSTLKELAPERIVAREAITQMHMAPVMFELGARPHPPGELYRAYLDQSDIFLGIYWQEYGWIAPDMTISGLEDEYNLSGDKPKLIYLKRPAPDIEPRLSALLSRIQNDALSYKPFSTAEELRDLIANDLAQIFTENFEALQAAPEPTEKLKAPNNNLPRPPTAFIGREKEVNAVCTLLRRHDTTLITLTETGGMGKTRLALQVAANVLEDFKDGVWFVELSPILDPNLVVPTIAQTLNVKETAEQSIVGRLKEYLQDKNLLLVLDTFEHLMDAAPSVGDLLQSVSHLKLLVTSREALHVYGEHEYPVPPLTMPDPKHLPDVQALAQYEAVRLFVARAQARNPAFEIDRHNAQAVVEICSKLDGIPLAIELAAGHIKAKSAHSISAGMSSRLKLLTGGPHNVPPRQRALRASIDWSYDLLKKDERRLFQRMSVFRGGCTLAAAEVVGSQVRKDKKSATSSKRPSNVHDTINEDLLNAITALVDKSLVRQQEGVDGEPRYSMLDTIHEYALEKLEERPEYEDIRRRHAHFYLALVDEELPELSKSQQVDWLNRLEEDHDNMRSVLRWAGEGATNTSLKRYRAGGGIEDERTHIMLHMTTRLWPFWHTRGYISEGREQLRSVRDIINMQGTESWRGFSPRNIEAYFYALYGASVLAMVQGDIEEAHSLQEKSMAIASEKGNKKSIATCLDLLSDIAEMEGDYIRARSLEQEYLLTMRGWGDKEGIAIALNALGFLAYIEGDYEEARSLIEEAMAIVSEKGDLAGIAFTCFNLGMVLLEQGDHKQGRSLLKKSLLILRELRDKGHTPASLVGFAELSLRGTSGGKDDLPRAERATRLLGASKALHEAMGTVPASMERKIYERALDKSRRILGEVVWEAAYQEGRTMSIEQAIAYALEEEEEN